MPGQPALRAAPATDRRRLSRIMGFMGALVLALFGVLGTPSAAAAYDEGTIHSRVNQSRASNGLGPLTLNASLSQVAAAWANQMAANGQLGHNPNYSGQIPGGWTKAAENVAQGYPSGAALHAGWMNSPGHRANVLGDFTDIGIAHISAGGTTWSVEVFAKYGASAPAPAPEPPPAATEPEPAPAPAPAAPPVPSPEPTTPSETPGAEPPEDSAAGPVPAPTSPFSEAAGSDDRQAESPAERARADSEASDGFATKAVLGTSLLIAMGIGLGGWLRFSRVD